MSNRGPKKAINVGIEFIVSNLMSFAKPSFRQIPQLLPRAYLLLGVMRENVGAVLGSLWLLFWGRNVETKAGIFRILCKVFQRTAS